MDKQQLIQELNKQDKEIIELKKKLLKYENYIKNCKTIVKCEICHTLFPKVKSGSDKYYPYTFTDCDHEIVCNDCVDYECENCGSSYCDICCNIYEIVIECSSCNRGYFCNNCYNDHKSCKQKN